VLTELCEQIGWLARGLGAEDWLNLLFIVVMAVLWLVAGLVKAMGKKRSQQAPPELDGLGGQRRPPGESWQQRLARRAEELQRRLEKEAGLRESHQPQPPARKTPTRPAEASGGKITVRPGQRGEPVLVYERPQTQSPMSQEPQVAREVQGTVAPEVSEPMPGSLTPLMAEPLRPLKTDGVQTNIPRESPGSESGAIIDYSDPEALRKAILSYEILGKPLVLRETFNQTWDS